jgi:hypothetical protein
VAEDDGGGPLDGGCWHISLACWRRLVGGSEAGRKTAEYEWLDCKWGVSGDSAIQECREEQWESEETKRAPSEPTAEYSNVGRWWWW